MPSEATTLVKFRRLLGDEGVEEFLAQTVNLAVSSDLIQVAAVATVVVDSTLQQKLMAHPTAFNLLETARCKLVEAAQNASMGLKHNFANKGRLLRFKADVEHVIGCLGTEQLSADLLYSSSTAAKLN